MRSINFPIFQFYFLPDIENYLNLAVASAILALFFLEIMLLFSYFDAQVLVDFWRFSVTLWHDIRESFPPRTSHKWLSKFARLSPNNEVVMLTCCRERSGKGTTTICPASCYIIIEQTMTWTIYKLWISNSKLLRNLKHWKIYTLLYSCINYQVLVKWRRL